MQEFRDLRVWQRSHRLVLAVFRATQRGRKCDYPGLIPQIRRAAASIPANIAEGCGHSGRREFARFLQMALASAFELDYHLILAAELGVIQQSTFLEFESEVKQIKKMLVTLIDRVRTRTSPVPSRPSAPVRGSLPPTNDQPPTTDNFVVSPLPPPPTVSPARCGGSSPPRSHSSPTPQPSP